MSSLETSTFPLNSQYCKTKSCRRVQFSQLYGVNVTKYRYVQCSIRSHRDHTIPREIASKYLACQRVVLCVMHPKNATLLNVWDTRIYNLCITELKVHVAYLLSTQMALFCLSAGISYVGTQKDIYGLKVA